MEMMEYFGAFAAGVFVGSLLMAVFVVGGESKQATKTTKRQTSVQSGIA